MYRGRTLSLGFPPFTPWVKRIIIICAGLYLLRLLLLSIAPDWAEDLLQFCALIPTRVVHGWVWQLATYSFLHAGTWHVVFNMLMLWMFGSQFESDWGSKQFLEFYFFCVVGAALATVGIAYSGIPGLSPATPTVGASGGIYGLLIAFGMLYGDRDILMFPLPFTIKAKYMVAILIFFVVAATIQPTTSGIANFAHLGGLLFGFLYVKFLPRRGILSGASERYFGLRNAYYRWKRRRAARKFEVYMRKHDRSQYFDQYGNYRGPESEDKEKGNGGSKSGWVN